MPKHILFLDNVENSPHGSLLVKKSKQQNNFWNVDNLLGHFDGYSSNSFYNLKHHELFSNEDIKYIFSFVHMPITNFPYLSTQALDLLRNDSNTYLILFSALEYTITEKELYIKLSRLNIPLEKVVVLCSNIEAHNKELFGVKYICINFWESYSKKHLTLLPGGTISSPQTRLTSLKTARKKFLSLNRNVKPHRIWFYYSLIKTNTLDQGHVSFHLPDVDPVLFKKEIHDFHHVLRKIPQKLHSDFQKTAARKMYTRKLDILDKDNIINYKDTTTPFYNDSVVSLITESDDSKNFLTEKTYKAIANLHPFFIIGNPDQHALLRARGYYTFEDLFQVERVNNYREACDLLQRINETSIEVLRDTVRENYFDKLLHNQQNFLTRKTSWDAILKEIKKRFGTDKN